MAEYVVISVNCLYLRSDATRDNALGGTGNSGDRDRRECPNVDTHMSKPIWTTTSKRLDMIVGTGAEGTTEGQEKGWEG